MKSLQGGANLEVELYQGTNVTLSMQSSEDLDGYTIVTGVKGGTATGITVQASAIDTENKFTVTFLVAPTTKEGYYNWQLFFLNSNRHLPVIEGKLKVSPSFLGTV